MSLSSEVPNESVRRTLRIAVERAVRPVHASSRRRRRMREELFAHLCEVFSEEYHTLGNEETACQRALARFGDPAELTPELQCNVGIWERDFGRWENSGDPEQPLGKLAYRLIGRTLVLAVMLSGLLCVPLMLAGEGQIAGMFAFMQATFALASAGAIVALQWMAKRLGERSYREMLVAREWRTLLVSHVVMTVLFLAAAGLSVVPLALARERSEHLGYVYVLVALGGSALVFSVLFQRTSDRLAQACSSAEGPRPWGRIVAGLIAASLLPLVWVAAVYWLIAGRLLGTVQQQVGVALLLVSLGPVAALLHGRKILADRSELDDWASLPIENA